MFDVVTFLTCDIRHDCFTLCREFVRGTRVLALFPVGGTTVLYPARVVQTPKQVKSIKRAEQETAISIWGLTMQLTSFLCCLLCVLCFFQRKSIYYLLRFEDDEGMFVRNVHLLLHFS